MMTDSTGADIMELAGEVMSALHCLLAMLWIVFPGEARTHSLKFSALRCRYSLLSRRNSLGVFCLCTGGIIDAGTLGGCRICFLAWLFLSSSTIWWANCRYPPAFRCSLSPANFSGGKASPAKDGLQNPTSWHNALTHTLNQCAACLGPLNHILK